MPESDIFKRYLETGLALGQLTRARAEALAKDLVRAGEIQRGQAQDWVEDAIDRSRRNTEAVVELVRGEVARQVSAMGLINRDDLVSAVSGLVAKVKEAVGAPNSAHTSSGARAAAKKTVAKKTAAKKTAAKKTAAKKTAAKKTAAKKTAAKKTGAKKTAAKKTAVKKTGAR
ncbi:MAG: histone H1-like repetitive region-containing protein [Acidimicrobiales bacterium]